MSIKEETEKSQKSCNFCGQEKLTFKICVDCRDELMNFQTESELLIAPTDFKSILNTFYWSCNLFLGYLEQFDITTISPNEVIPDLKKDLNYIVVHYRPSATYGIDDELRTLIEKIANNLTYLKRANFVNKEDRQLFHVFPIVFWNFHFMLKFLSKII